MARQPWQSSTSTYAATSGFSNTCNDPSPSERHGELLCFSSLIFWSRFNLKQRFTFLFFSHLLSISVVSFSIGQLVRLGDRRCRSLEFSLIVVEVVVVLYSSSLEPKLELSYPPSGDVGLLSWLIAFRTLQRVVTTALACGPKTPITPTSILPPVTKKPLLTDSHKPLIKKKINL